MCHSDRGMHRAKISKYQQTYVRGAGHDEESKGDEADAGDNLNCVNHVWICENGKWVEHNFFSFCATRVSCHFSKKNINV